MAEGGGSRSSARDGDAWQCLVLNWRVAFIALTSQFAMVDALRVKTPAVDDGLANWF